MTSFYKDVLRNGDNGDWFLSDRAARQHDKAYEKILDKEMYL